MQHHIVDKLGEHLCGVRHDPVVAQPAVGEGAYEAEGVVHVDHVVGREVVADIHILQRLQRIFCCLTCACGHTLYLRHEADVGGIVEHGEERDLRELGDTGEEDKLLVYSLGLEHREHLAIDGGNCLVVGCVPRVLQG